MCATRLHFRDDLEALGDRVLEMCGEVDIMLARAMVALSQNNVDTANEVILRDDRVDHLDLQIETECMRLIALQQPMGRDLRHIGASMKIITDLERIGDHAVNIAKIAKKLAMEPYQSPIVDMPRLANSVREMLKAVMVAYVTADLKLVSQVISDDDGVNRIYHQIRDELHATMRTKPTLVVHASHLLFVGHYLERIADHIVNIAERVYYTLTGEVLVTHDL